MDLSFDIGKRLPEGPGKHGRSGVIHPTRRYSDPGLHPGGH